MKRLIILAWLLVASWALFAQVGLFNLEYTMPLTQADSLLVAQGFKLDGRAETLVRYFPVETAYVSAIILFVEPKTERVVGWFIKYNASNTEENDDYVIKRIQELHGKTNHYDDETKQLIWFLSTTRTVFVVYTELNELTVLYYDSHFPEIFRLNDGSTPVQDLPEAKPEE